MSYQHLCYYDTARRKWIVKSVDGSRSLQLAYPKKPTDEQAEKDYTFLDGKLDLGKWAKDHLEVTRDQARRSRRKDTA